MDSRTAELERMLEERDRRLAGVSWPEEDQEPEPRGPTGVLLRATQAIDQRVAQLERANSTRAAKPGVRTSEFWVTAATALVALGIATGYVDTGRATDLAGQLETILGLLGAAGVSVGYTAMRTKAKSGR